MQLLTLAFTTASNNFELAIAVSVRVIQALYGEDINATQRSKSIDEIPAVDVVITMGCNVDCPHLPCKHREDWGLENPSGKPEEEFIRSAKKIEEKGLDLKYRMTKLW